MNIQQSINRGFNLLAVSITGLAGFAFAPEMFLENEWADRADDMAVFALGVVAIIWYLFGNNKYTRAVAPVVFVLLALLAKIGAIKTEFDDKDAVGDDFGGLILFVLAAGLVFYQYVKTKKLLAQQNIA